MGDAIISPCGQYRYTLTRTIAQAGDRGCLFVMLNPSTADASLDDPTIRRCIGFATREGCARLTVVNLFAYRATDPRDLLDAYRGGIDIEGPENRRHLNEQIAAHGSGRGIIIAAWGAHPVAGRAPTIQRWLRDVGALCLGITAGGHPRHPLYVPSYQPLMRWKNDGMPEAR